MKLFFVSQGRSPTQLASLPLRFLRDKTRQVFLDCGHSEWAEFRLPKPPFMFGMLPSLETITICSERRRCGRHLDSDGHGTRPVYGDVSVGVVGRSWTNGVTTRMQLCNSAAGMPRKTCLVPGSALNMSTMDTTASQVHDFRLLAGKESLYWEAWVRRATQVTDIVVPSLVRRVIHSLYVRDVQMGAWELISHCKTEHQKVMRQSCGPASTKGTSIKSLHRTAVFVIMSD